MAKDKAREASMGQIILGLRNEQTFYPFESTLNEQTLLEMTDSHWEVYEFARATLTNKGRSSQGYGFSCGHVWM